MKIEVKIPAPKIPAIPPIPPLPKIPMPKLPKLPDVSELLALVKLPEMKDLTIKVTVGPVSQELKASDVVSSVVPVP